MQNILCAWKYTELVSEARRAALAAPGSFKKLVCLVTADACAISARARSGWDHGLTDCVQPIFTLEVPNAGDPLFNGPWGYRAQYLASPYEGLAANGMLLASLAPKLLAAIDLSVAPELEKIDVCASLHAASAKLWIQEDFLRMINPPSHLAVERWVTEACRGAELASLGLWAPTEIKFEVKGAFLDPYGNEIVPHRKIRRHYEIHHYGFS